HAGASLRPGIAQDQHRVLGDVEIVAVDRSLHRRIVVEYQRRPGVLQELGRAGRRFDDADVWGQVALQHRQRAFLVDRVADRADDVGVVDLGALYVLAQRPAGDGQRIEMQVALDLVQETGQAAGIEEILHQVFVAARADVGDYRNLAAGGLEVVEPDVLAGATGQSDQVDDGIGRAADGHGHGDGVEEGLAAQDLRRRQVLPHHVDDAPAAL